MVLGGCRSFLLLVTTILRKYRIQTKSGKTEGQAFDF